MKKIMIVVVTLSNLFAVSYGQSLDGAWRCTDYYNGVSFPVWDKIPQDAGA